jgi:hypothetical protein
MYTQFIRTIHIIFLSANEYIPKTDLVCTSLFYKPKLYVHNIFYGWINYIWIWIWFFKWYHFCFYVYLQTTDEYKQYLNGFKGLAGAFPNNTKYFLRPDVDSAPSTVDWRTKGYVTGVKNQVRDTIAVGFKLLALIPVFPHVFKDIFQSPTTPQSILWADCRHHRPWRRRADNRR